MQPLDYRGPPAPVPRPRRRSLGLAVPSQTALGTIGGWVGYAFLFIVTSASHNRAVDDGVLCCGLLVAAAATVATLVGTVVAFRRIDSEGCLQSGGGLLLSLLNAALLLCRASALVSGLVGLFR